MRHVSSFSFLRPVWFRFEIFYLYVVPPAFNVTGVIDRYPPALELVTDGAEAFGTLPDSESDYERYAMGALLVSYFAQA